MPASYPCPFWTKPFGPRCGLVRDYDGSNVPLLSLLMVYLLTGSFQVGLRIPRISPILAGTGVSARLLWAMLIPVHLRGWELSLHSHPTSKTELFKPASFVSAYTLAGLSSHPGLYSLSGERVERYPKPAGHPTDSASEPDLTVSRHPAPQKSGRQVPVLVAILVG